MVHPVQIGPLQVPSNLWLAPMAGISDLPFRRIARRLGAGLVCTELVSARGIRFSGGVRSSLRYLTLAADEHPVAIQLFGFDPDDFVFALEKIMEEPLLRSFDALDINMGCPVPKVVRTGAGSHLMETPELAAAIVQRCRRFLEPYRKPVTVKIRRGFAADSNQAADFAKRMAAAGAQAVTVHARTREQYYSGKADWSVIREVRQALPDQLPVIGNGDIVDAASARRCLEQTGCDGLMIGRAASGDPWIFARLQAELTGKPWREPELWARGSVICEHFDGLTALLGDQLTAAREMRHVLMHYFRGLPDARQLRQAAGQLTSRGDLLQVLRQAGLLGASGQAGAGQGCISPANRQ
ncbi:tRNA dihydrouridine synthase DusB [Oscillospiraceae bacterium HV4-5-C5C]|nr:tRNA dihydrouridine synthase DusB [Oscillospiraceae bacterium HV4-5-C5C]